MKKYLLRILLGLTFFVFSLFFILWGAITLGILSVGISPYAHYKLNQKESQLIEASIARFREKIENAQFDQIKNELIQNGRDEWLQNYTMQKVENIREEFGKPQSIEFFRALPPKPVNKYFENLSGTLYMVSYFTKAEKGEFSEHFDWIINENDEVTLLTYSGNKMQDWEIKNRERESFINANYPNEIRIPFGERFIEIRY